MCSITISCLMHERWREHGREVTHGAAVWGGGLPLVAGAGSVVHVGSGVGVS